jgi:hypothetical protein
MASQAPKVASLYIVSRSRPLPDLFTPSAERRSLIRYPGGHEVRINREHLERILAAKAGVDMEVSGG